MSGLARCVQRGKGMSETQKQKAAKDWACMECGKRMTARQAERASFGDKGCPKCGGSDIDLAPTEGK